MIRKMRGPGDFGPPGACEQTRKHSKGATNRKTLEYFDCYSWSKLKRNSNKTLFRLGAE